MVDISPVLAALVRVIKVSISLIRRPALVGAA
jgi:hypothetical protein